MIQLVDSTHTNHSNFATVNYRGTSMNSIRISFLRRSFAFPGLTSLLAYWLVLCPPLLRPVEAQMPTNYQLQTDWLIEDSSFKANVSFDQSSGRITISNGLVERVFDTRLSATVRYSNLMTGQEMIRAIEPEAQLVLDGVEIVLGGADSQPNKAFLTDKWLAEMKPIAGAMRSLQHQIGGETKERFAWNRVRHHAPDVKWPPAGKYLRLDYGFLEDFNANKAGLKISIHFEIYDGIPLICKWITVTNSGGTTLTVDRFVAERLSVVEHSNPVETRDGVSLPKPDVLHVETDMAFGGFNHANANRHVVHWQTDPTYSTQVNYQKQMPVLLEVKPTFGPSQDILPGETFETFRTFELAYDSADRERRGLSLRKMYRTIAPWVTENPLMLHCKTSDPDRVRSAIDQAAEVGFEMVILSFGSGFDAENDSPEYLELWKSLNDYALAKGVHLGSYSLYSSRSGGQGNDIVPPEGLSNAHGRCPAITSPWGQVYLARLYQLFERTGFLVFENDGPYPGDVDTTERLPLQKGVHDSRWVHWRIWTDLYKHLRSRGVYMNLPDYYFLSGSNKCGMGYREVNWSLPRAQQQIHTRQNIFDGTWEKTPSMGWMFVPLTEYHGGGAAATIEPLDQHRDHYDLMLKSNLGLGVQACYRGPRLFDTPATAKMVKQNVSWFKQHRAILESDLIHGRRADGRDLDWMLHVNPKLDERALLAIYNPTDRPITKTIFVPLYYAGLNGSVAIQDSSTKVSNTELDSASRARITVTVPAEGFEYFVFSSERR